MSQKHSKFTNCLAEIRALLKDLNTIDAEFWEGIEDGDQLDMIKAVMVARNFLRDVYGRFEWD